MFKPLVALLAVAALPGTAFAQSATLGDWKLEAGSGGCVVHTAAASGTVVSIWGLAGAQSLSFLVQKKDWDSFADGQRYDIDVSFDNSRSWAMKAVARHNIDRDGPGLSFTVSPTQAGGGASFLEQFAASGGMRITGNDQVETITLADTEIALKGLAQCMDRLFSGASGEAGEGGGTVVVASADARKI